MKMLPRCFGFRLVERRSFVWFLKSEIYFKKFEKLNYSLLFPHFLRNRRHQNNEFICLEERSGKMVLDSFTSFCFGL